MSDEKTESPTEKKLKDARKDGKVPKSADLAAAASLLGGSAALSFAGGPLGDHFRQLLTIGLDVAHAASPDLNLTETLKAIALEASVILLPILIAALLLPLAALAMQTGLQISFKPLELNGNAVNPAAGIKRLFSLRSLLELAKTMIKAVVLGAILYKVVLLLVPATASVAYQPIDDVIEVSWRGLCRFVMVAGLVYLVLGAADFGIQLWLFMREQRMSKDEVKREYKESEGDPDIKGKRKQIARENVESAPAKHVTQAQAVVVNPTHYAVAIRYVPEEHGLPRVIAKGVDADAFEIREAARAAGIPIIPHAPLARALYRVPLEQAIPEMLFEAVAEILAWVAQLGAQPSTQ
ncbi:type III secretion system export apparatus subunit SctU [Paraburkholderia humisilvae]|uniref:Flagellar biosynthetic protein FlhB n=1 Tax=Paraburkholderia humisilvae TaxID=627669 RepID=A0A6J5F7K3_9BURK|nr:type III secretion system export apparatus subunit SctU [Paraburkholderia humisilvae]CAB3773592.1 Flagellar biosynthetic protein FlhB [Paraburkholderia humisilvae]